MNDAPTAAPSRESASDSTREERSELTGNETTLGRNCEAKSLTGTNRLNQIPSARPVSVILSGNSLVSASVKMSPRSRKASAEDFKVASDIPKCHEHARKSAAVSTSTIR